MRTREYQRRTRMILAWDQIAPEDISEFVVDACDDLKKLEKKYAYIGISERRDSIRDYLEAICLRSKP